MEDFTQYCKDMIINDLPDYDGYDTYGCDLAYLIMEAYLADGSLTYSTQEALSYIKEWWYDCEEFYDYAKMSFGSDYVIEELNVFDNPEKFMLMMVSEGIGYLLGKVSVISDNWNDSIELTEDIINTIIEEIGAMNEVEW